MTDLRFEDRMLVISWFAADARRVSRELRDDAEALCAQAAQARSRTAELRSGWAVRHSRREASDQPIPTALKE